MRKAMEAADYGVAEAAMRFGVGRNTVSNWIHDRTQPSAIVLEVWADWTGVPLLWLQTGIVPTSGDGGSRFQRGYAHDDGVVLSGRFRPEAPPTGAAA